MTSNQIKVLDKGFIQLIDSMGSDLAIVEAARVSYGNGSKGEEQDRKLLQYLLTHHHTSPFEQVQFKFHIKCPIFVARQWMRHRTWSYNEISGRYTEMKDEFYIPARVFGPDPKNKQGSSLPLDPEIEKKFKLALLDNSMTNWEIYQYWLNKGVSKETARFFLPLNTYTELYASVNLHNLLHFLTLRLDSHAQEEIRNYAKIIVKLITPVVPVTVDLWSRLRDPQTPNASPPNSP